MLSLYFFNEVPYSAGCSSQIDQLPQIRCYSITCKDLGGGGGYPRESIKWRQRLAWSYDSTYAWCVKRDAYVSRDPYVGSRDNHLKYITRLCLGIYGFSCTIDLANNASIRNRIRTDPCPGHPKILLETFWIEFQFLKMIINPIYFYLFDYLMDPAHVRSTFSFYV